MTSVCCSQQVVVWTKANRENYCWARHIQDLLPGIRVPQSQHSLPIARTHEAAVATEADAFDSARFLKRPHHLSAVNVPDRDCGIITAPGEQLTIRTESDTLRLVIRTGKGPKAEAVAAFYHR